MNIDPTYYEVAARLFSTLVGIGLAFGLCFAFIVIVTDYVNRRELREWMDEERGE